jgi:hypothetical protein
MCGVPNHEQGPFQCSQVIDNTEYHTALNSFYHQQKDVHEDMQKLGVDAALAKHHLPRRWTPTSIGAALIPPPIDPHVAGPSNANAEGGGPMDA